MSKNLNRSTLIALEYLAQLKNQALTCFALLVSLGSFSAVGSQEPICSDSVANPPINEGPLQNPLKGFHVGFDASCCLEFPHEVYFGNFMATVGYQNFTWAELEPEDDVFNWDKVEQDLANRAGSKQKHVIVQLNAEWTRGQREADANNPQRTPQWFLDDERFETNEDELGFANGGYQSHRYTSEFYQSEVKEFIAEFIHRFKDDPRIFVIQMGMVGYFGEFNVFPNDDIWLPEEVKTLFFEHYRDHIFGQVERNTDGDLVVIESGEAGINSGHYNGLSALTQVRYPAELGYNIPTDGIGYTNGWINVDGIPNDGNNDVDIGNKDFNDPLDEIISDEGRKLWTYGPVGGEWPPNREPTIEGVIEEWTSFWGTDLGEQYIQRGHYSFARPPQVDTISNLLGADNWGLVPAGWNFFAGDAQEIGDNYSTPGGDTFRRWHKIMGYNYQLSNIQHFLDPAQSNLTVSFDLNNIGLAAFHFNWDVELGIINSNGDVVQIIPLDHIDMRDWKSATTTTVVTQANLLPELDLDGSEYRIALRFIQPAATDVKDDPWQLAPRVTYIEISNDVEVIDGSWDDQNRLVGGWNILDNLNPENRQRSCSEEEQLCVPIKAANNTISVICL